MARKPSIKTLCDFAMVESHEQLVWRRNWQTGELDRYNVVRTEVWQVLLADDQEEPAVYVNPGKKDGTWRCEDRGCSDPWGSPLRKTYQETWVRKGVTQYV